MLLTTVLLQVKSSRALKSVRVTVEWVSARQRRISKSITLLLGMRQPSSSIRWATYPDPDHSPEEHREITIGCTMKKHVVFVPLRTRRAHSNH